MIDFAQQAEASGTPFLNLRLNLSMQGLLLFKNLIASHGVIAASIGDALVSLTDVREIAAVATGTESGHEGHTCNPTGPQALSPRPKTDERQAKARSDKPRKRPAANRKVRKRATSQPATNPRQKANGPARNGTQWAPAAGSPAADQTAQRQARARSCNRTEEQQPQQMKRCQKATHPATSGTREAAPGCSPQEDQKTQRHPGG